MGAIGSSWRVAINGYGRIGQTLLRALLTDDAAGARTLDVVAINDLAPPDTLIHLTRYDSTHGPLALPVEPTAEGMQVGRHRVRLLNEARVEALPWAELGVDLVLECSGAAAAGAYGHAHVQSGAARVLLSRPGDRKCDRTVVYGYNHASIEAGDRVVSAASCTSNCAVPVLDVLQRQVGIESVQLTTVHAAMNDQPVTDSIRPGNLRHTRSALASIVPVDTRLAQGIVRLMPDLAGRISATALRIPIANVSLMNIDVVLQRSLSVAALNSLFGPDGSGCGYQGLLACTDAPLVSADYLRSPFSATIDATLTRVSKGRHASLAAWFDNEWAYARRMLDLAVHWQRVCCLGG